ncbi:MAG TPA: LysM peptidoglycan-binding domain-containing protein [Chromobacteriaceae bacterium]|nr:LysM peptidoglycan-binding domain-containing protein [Chromobacteriaceae bacterium]
MRKSIISLALALGLASPAFSDTLTLRQDAPHRYVVVKGDTLWGISGRFLKSPWKWPRLWNMNRSQVKNPHWIYPGDVLVLHYVNGQPRLSLERNLSRTVKLSPGVRSEALDDAVPSIPAAAIEPFLTRPLVVELSDFNKAPSLVAGPDDRVAVGPGDRAYAVGLNEGGTWQAYRPNRPLVDPDTKEVLGFEVIYGGDLQVDKMGDDIQSLHVSRIAEEIQIGDRLIKAPKALFVSYVPHEPESEIKGKIISIYNGVNSAAEYSNVVINRGQRDGVEVGHVFGIFRKGNLIEFKTADGRTRKAALPMENSGKLFVYRVFDRVSYALVLNSSLPVSIGDTIAPPEAE